MIGRTTRGLIAPAVLLACAASAAAQSVKPGSQTTSAKPGGQTAGKPAMVDGRTRETTPSGSAQSSRVQPQGFSVVLVVADLQGTAGQDDVPPAARKALTDMRDFLPYKSYKLLDAAWLLGQGTSSNLTRLRGLDEQEYELRLHVQPTGQPGDGAARVFVRFTLNDGGEAHAPAVVADQARRRAAEAERHAIMLRNELMRARQELEKKRQSLGTQHPDVKVHQQEVERLQAEMAAGARATERRAATVTSTRRPGNGAVIDTSFTMDVGETVVVGTSRLKGNGKALIALLTAVPPKGKL